jgi:hypothetical protein
MRDNAERLMFFLSAAFAVPLNLVKQHVQDHRSWTNSWSFAAQHFRC